MSTLQWLILSGLVLNILGTCMLGVFGVPQPSHEEPEVRVVYGSPPEEEKRRVARRRQRYVWLSRIALTAIAVGFVLQAIAVVLA